jgi:hypothetical protein
VTIRARRYLNNVVEQDHRAIKQRCRPMLGLKSFPTAAVTFSGIELAHRIRKRQFAIAYDYDGRSLSLKELWAQALSGKSLSGNMDNSPPPLTHQISRPSPPRVRGERARLGVLRHPRRVSFGKSLYLLVTPKGGRLWHYRYRFQGREKLLSLGCYPDVPMESARARQNAARRLLDLGVDPAERRAELRQISTDRA